MNIHQLIEKAMQTAQGAQAALRQSETIDVSFENDHLKSALSAQRTEISLKVFVNGKSGDSTTTDPADLDGLVQRALEAAAFGRPVFYQLPGWQPSPEVEVFDPAVVKLSKTEMVQTGQVILDKIKAYNPEIVVSTSATQRIADTVFANSNSAEYAYTSTLYSLGVSGQLVRGTDILWTGFGRSWRQPRVNPLSLAEKTINLMRMAEQVAPVKSGSLPVIFTPDGLIVLLFALLQGINGKSVFLGASPLKGKLGDKIAGEQLTILDNPLVDYAPGSSSYDSEGTPHQVTPILENGVLKNFLYDLDTAGRAGVKSTGHGFGCHPTNLLIHPGDVSFDQMVKNTKEGLLVNDVIGLGQGNVLSGEFSVNVQLGYKIENGEIVGRVKDVMLAGNTYSALKQIIAISSQPEWISSEYGANLCAPYIQVDGLSVIGK